MVCVYGLSMMCARFCLSDLCMVFVGYVYDVCVCVDVCAWFVYGLCMMFARFCLICVWCVVGYVYDVCVDVCAWFVSGLRYVVCTICV